MAGCGKGATGQTMPMIGFCAVRRSLVQNTVAAFRQGLNIAGFVEVRR